MRVTTAFNRMLGIAGASVASVTFTPEGIVIGLRRRRRRPQCPCGWKGRAVYDRSIRRWRHLDLAASRLFLEAEIRRLRCRHCQRVRTEAVPWARPGARLSRDFEDVIAFMAQRMDKTTITRLLRTSWETVASVVIRVVAEHIDGSRLDGLYRIGVDEVSYRKGHRYLTVIADHDQGGAVVWAKEGKSHDVLESFFTELGEERTRLIEAISLDMSGAWAKALDENEETLGHIRRCIDPFHVVRLANTAIEKTRRAWWNVTRCEGGRSRWVKHTRWALLKDPADLKESQRLVLDEVRRSHSVLWRSYLLKESLRELYKLGDAALARAHLDHWLAWACRSRIPSFVALSKTLRQHKEGIIAAVELGLSNSKLEGLNSKIRLISHRAFGFHSADPLIALVYLCCAGITIDLPR